MGISGCWVIRCQKSGAADPHQLRGSHRENGLATGTRRAASQRPAPAPPRRRQEFRGYGLVEAGTDRGHCRTRVHLHRSTHNQVRSVQPCCQRRVRSPFSAVAANYLAGRLGSDRQFLVGTGRDTKVSLRCAAVRLAEIGVCRNSNEFTWSRATSPPRRAQPRTNSPRWPDATVARPRSLSCG